MKIYDLKESMVKLKARCIKIKKVLCINFKLQNAKDKGPKILKKEKKSSHL